MGLFAESGKGFCGARRAVPVADMLLGADMAPGSLPRVAYAHLLAYTTLNFHV
jgi:hypothetical protein